MLIQIDMKPKILILSNNNFSKTHNNGKTLSAIFSAFEPGQLCQLYTTLSGQLDFDRCKNYYYISDIDAMKSIFCRKRCGMVVNHVENVGKTSVSIKKKVRPNKINKFFRSIMWLFSSWYHGGLVNWLSEQDPDLIFFVGGDSYHLHSMAVRLHKRLSIPLVTYFTDDYIINAPSDLYRWFLKKVYNNTISHSSKLFAIGKYMSEEYAAYYNREFNSIMNIVEIEDNGSWSLNEPGRITISFFGGLHLGRMHEIIRFGHFMKEKIVPEIKYECVINVFSFATPTYQQREEMKNLGIVFHSGKSGIALVEAMKKSDLLLHVESVEKEYHLLTKLSVSTKIPEYMSFFKPIIAFGPADVASFKVIAEASPLMVIDDVQDTKKMSDQADNIITILSSSQMLSNIAYHNFKYAKEHFDKKVVSIRFKRDLETLLGNI